MRTSSSGNRAFDEYRAETLRRLEEEQREFKEFLDRLRHAKDKAEFDQFMAERGRRPPGPAASAGGLSAPGEEEGSAHSRASPPPAGPGCALHILQRSDGRPPEAIGPTCKRAE